MAELEVGTRRPQCVSTTITPGRNLRPSSTTRRRAIYAIFDTPRCSRVSRYLWQNYDLLERFAIRHAELGFIGKQRLSLHGVFISNTKMHIIYRLHPRQSTYGHSQLKTGHPVRSAIHKQLNGRLVLRWVTTWESLLLYVLFPLLLHHDIDTSYTCCGT